jgi:uncharacterized protein DUF4835
MKRILSYRLILYILLTFNSSYAQEFLCQVNVDASQLSGATNQAIFAALKGQVYDFMNNYRFTNDKFEQNEKIDCAINIVVNSDLGSGTYSGVIELDSERPMFQAGIRTPLFDFDDKYFTFTYLQGQPFDFNLQGFSSNLTSVLGYYAYVMLALDYDSFSLLGGTDMWKKAQTVVQNAQSATEPGWQSSDNSFKNRYTYIDNIMSPMFQPLRESFYTYHRKGLDIMYDKPEDGRAAIMQALDNINEVHKNRPASYNVQVFFEAKNREIVNIFKNATPEEKTKVLNILATIDPANTTIYSQITSP